MNRDDVAAFAMQGILAGLSHVNLQSAAIATVAYDMADAMQTEGAKRSAEVGKANASANDTAGQVGAGG